MTTHSRLRTHGFALAFLALGLSGIWIAVLPAILLCWRLAPADWVYSLLAGLLGLQWAYVGAVALGAWPQYRLQIGLAWASWPAVLAVASWRLRA